MKLQQNLNKRERLINLIHACNDERVRADWIIELSNMDDIECSESQCDSCPIAIDCLDVLQLNCDSDCKVYDNERCGGCPYGK